MGVTILACVTSVVDTQEPVEAEGAPSRSTRRRFRTS